MKPWIEIPKIPTLRSFIDYQYHHQHVTQPLLLEQLRDYGIDISSGELNQLAIENKESFHQEKTEILPAALAVSSYVHVDDTGARHQGKNGFCTPIPITPGNAKSAFPGDVKMRARVNVEFENYQ